MSQQLEEKVRRQFDKHFRFPAINGSLKLPAVSKWWSNEAWNMPQVFLDMQEELNAVKSRLNDKPLKKWHTHTRAVNPANMVVSEVRHVADPQLLTQAWCKFTECLNKFELVNKRYAENLHTLHLCEAPGAFITALHHFLRSSRHKEQRERNWDWRGITLNPFYEGNTTSQMINDDRLITATLDQWIFGNDNTGDILDAKNRGSMLRCLSDVFPSGVHIVTADGSIDCQGDPARQEDIVSELHLVEVAIALTQLRRGGNLVLKMFTFFTASSACIMYLLRYTFHELDVYKPGTSKEGNSEVYVVARDYKKNLSSQQVEALVSKSSQSTGKGAMFDRNVIPKAFIATLEECARFFKNLQIEVIEKNIKTFESYMSYSGLKDLKLAVAKEFCRRYNIEPIVTVEDWRTKRSNDKAVLVYKLGSCKNMDDRYEQGSFESNSQHKQINGNLEPYLETLKVQLLTITIPSKEVRKSNIVWHDTKEFFPHPEELIIVMGKRIDRLRSSKFCTSLPIDLVYRVNSVVIQNPKNSPNEKLSARPKRRRLMTNSRFSHHGDGGNDADPSKSRRRNLLSNFTDQGGLLEKLYHMYTKNATTVRVQFCGRDDLLHPDTAYWTNLVNGLEKNMELLNSQDSLLLHCMSLLTRVEVGILFILAKYFYKIGFVKARGCESAIFLWGFRKDFYENSMRGLLRDLKMALQASSEASDLLQIHPIKHLIRSEYLYSTLMAFNINCLKEYGLEILSNRRIS